MDFLVPYTDRFELGIVIIYMWRYFPQQRKSVVGINLVLSLELDRHMVPLKWMPGFDMLKDLDMFIGQVGPFMQKVRFRGRAVDCLTEAPL